MIFLKNPSLIGIFKLHFLKVLLTHATETKRAGFDATS